MLDANFGGAFIAGLLSFVSPCVLPIVPPYLAYMAGLSFDELKSNERSAAVTRRIAISAFAFVLGFTTVFVALGATASVIGQSIARYFDTLSLIAGFIIIVMGLHFIGVFRIPLLYREARVHVARKPAGILGAYVIGLAFAFGWTPCVGPVLAAILFIAGAEGTAVRGAALLAAYSAGIGIPFLLTGIFANRFLNWIGLLRNQMRRVEIGMGIILVITGILFMTGQMATIANWLLETFPAFSTIG